MASFTKHVGIQVFGLVGAAYLWAVRLSTLKFRIHPEDYHRIAAEYLPCIIASWHGQNYLLPFAKRYGESIKVLASKSGDGRRFASVIKYLGFEIIAGSGAGNSPIDLLRKGGSAALEGMIKALCNGNSIAMTADVPKKSRIVGPGIIKLAHDTGRPIVPSASASSRRHILNNWDRTAIDCPFSRRIDVVFSEPIFVKKGDDLEERRLQVERALNDVTARAMQISCGGKTGVLRCRLLGYIEGIVERKKMKRRARL
jgi:lysophospholipid acyltransferase (LPLAT)-like uncharacterized protein